MNQKLTVEELHAKFRGLVEPVVGPACTGRMLTKIERLEELPDVRLLAEDFCPRRNS